MSAIISKVMNFLKNSMLISSSDQITENQDLVAGGIIDSFSAVKLVMFLEEEFKIKIQIEDLTEENISSLENIEKLVLKKQANS